MRVMFPPPSTSLPPGEGERVDSRDVVQVFRPAPGRPEGLHYSGLREIPSVGSSFRRRTTATVARTADVGQGPYRLDSRLHGNDIMGRE